MKTVRVACAEPLGINPEPVKILINEKIPQGLLTKEIGHYYDNQAKIIADALVKALPQGTVEPLIMHLMESRTSLYMGVMERKP